MSLREGQIGQVCDTCAASDWETYDRAIGATSHTLDLLTATCPICKEPITRCEECSERNEPHEDCDPPED